MHTTFYVSLICGKLRVAIFPNVSGSVTAYAGFEDVQNPFTGRSQNHVLVSERVETVTQGYLLVEQFLPTQEARAALWAKVKAVRDAQAE